MSVSLKGHFISCSENFSTHYMQGEKKISKYISKFVQYTKDLRRFLETRNEYLKLFW
jgi:hypothetical protein